MPGNLGAAISGLVTVSALLAAESATRETYGETVGAVLLALLLYWVAKSYAEFAATRVRERRPLSGRGLARAMLHELPIVGGSTPPLLAVLVSWVVGAALENAITAAIWTASGTILLTEVAAGIRAELSARELLIQTCVGAALGLLVLVLRLLLH